MKRILLLLLIAMPISLLAQNIDEVKNLINYRRYETAEQKAKALVESDKNNGAYWFWLSQVYVNSKDSAALVNLQLPALDDAWFRLTKANILLTKGNNEQARVLFDQALGNSRKKDKDLLAAAARSNIYITNGDKNYAVDLLKQAIKRDKHDPELFTMLGDAWFRLRNGSEAYTAYQDALKENNRYAPALFQLGKIFATQNNTELFLKYYNEAVAADPSFSPAWYELYYQSFANDKRKAFDYYQKYLATTDINENDEYQQLDLLYLTAQYNEAIKKANDISSRYKIQNRINKLLAYTYSAINLPDKALQYMNTYFSNGADSSYLIKDYQLMAKIYNMQNNQDSAVAWEMKLLPLLKDSSEMYGYYKEFYNYYKQKKDYDNQVKWAEKFYNNNRKASNVDLFNWGLALYLSENYQDADSVFGMYADKYPGEVYGTYWQARSLAAIDTAMTEGLAIPYYEKMISIAEKDTSNSTNKKYLAEAYGYIAAYTANEKKDYTAAIDYFEKLLEVDPGNKDAIRYIEILEKHTAAAADEK